MRKTIKVDEAVYDRLDAFCGKHESFGKGITRLLDIRDGIVSLTNTIEGVTAYAKYRAEKLAESTAGDTRQDTP